MNNKKISIEKHILCFLASFSFCFSPFGMANSNLQKVNNDVISKVSEKKLSTNNANNECIVRIDDNFCPIPTVETSYDITWINSIKNSSNNNIVKLFFTNSTFTIMQQAFLALNYMINENENTEKNQKIAFFYNQNSQQYFDFLDDYKNLMFINNVNQIGGTSNIKYNNIPSNEMLDLISKFYKNLYGDDIKFDIWIPESSLTFIWNNHYNSFFELLPNINKIYLLTSGNYQTNNFVLEYIKEARKNNISKDEIESNLKFLQNKNASFENRYNKFYKTKIYNYLISDLFTIFHNIEYVDSPYYNINKNKMYKAYLINYDYIDLSIKLFKNNDNNELKIKKYINNYENVFNLQNNYLKSFVYKGIENYDPSKKNVIWIGDYLIKDIDNIDSKRLEELQKVFLAFTRKYSPNEYNYFFKQHYSYDYKTQEKLTNLITSLTNGVKPIMFKNIPWELFLSWDRNYLNACLNNDHQSFFEKYDDNNFEQKTRLIGMQFTSNILLTTYSFLVKQYGIPSEQAWQYINPENFPVSGISDIQKPGKSSWKSYDKQYRLNLTKIEEIYEPIYQKKLIPNYSKSIKSASTFLKENNINFSPINTNKTKLDIFLTSLATAVAVLIVVIPLIVYVIKKRNEIKLKGIINEVKK